MEEKPQILRYIFKSLNNLEVELQLFFLKSEIRLKAIDQYQIYEGIFDTKELIKTYAFRDAVTLLQIPIMINDKLKCSDFTINFKENNLFMEFDFGYADYTFELVKM